MATKSVRATVQERGRRASGITANYRDELDWLAARHRPDGHESGNIRRARRRFARCGGNAGGYRECGGAKVLENFAGKCHQDERRAVIDGGGG